MKHSPLCEGMRSMVDDMFSFEKKGSSLGYTRVCGIDEAGRGPLAGPVCAAAVILPGDFDVPGVDDSKKLSAKKREVLYDVITSKALAYAIAFASEKEIDEFNILRATFLAMRRAVEGLQIQPDLAMVDGNADPGLYIPTWTIVKGDGCSASIAAASILAKVTRDREMCRLDHLYPEYGFAVHKGYPTKQHYENLRNYGPTPVHRLSFLKNFQEVANYGR